VLQKAVSMGIVDTTKSPLPFGPITFHKQQSAISPFGGQPEDALSRHNYLVSSTVTSGSAADR